MLYEESQTGEQEDVNQLEEWNNRNRMITIAAYTVRHVSLCQFVIDF